MTNASGSSNRFVKFLIGALLAVSTGLVVVGGSSAPASAQACTGCVVLSAPTINLNVTAQPGGQATIDQPGGVAVYTPLTTGTPGGPGTVWIIGHRTSHGSVFNEVPFLAPGAPVSLINESGVHQYIVNRLLVVPARGWQPQVDIHDMSRVRLIIQTSHPDPSLRYLIEAFGVVPEVCRTSALPVGDPNLSSATTRFVAIPAQRLLDTRLDGAGAVCGGGNISLKVAGLPGISPNATAVALTVTATDSRGPGFVSVGPAGVDPSGTSSVNLNGASQTRANLVMVALGLSGQIAIHASVTTHLVIDISGYFEPSSSAHDGRFIDVVPERLLDTRTDGTQHRLHSGETVTVGIAERLPRFPTAEVGAVLVNFTIANGIPPGYLTAWASGMPQPATSNVNASVIGDVAANLAIVPLGADGSIQLFASTDLDVIIDIVGYFTSSNAPEATIGFFVPVTPRRVVDTRTSRPALGADTTTDFDLVGLAGTVGPVNLVANLTSTMSRGDGFVSITDGSAPSTSNLNVVRGETRANLAIISSPNAELTHVYVSLQTHIIIDVTGYFTTDTLPRTKFGAIRS